MSLSSWDYGSASPAGVDGTDGAVSAEGVTVVS
jgi:hypothetical protein